MPKTLIGWAFAILVGVWIISNPAAAGADIRSWIADIFTFFHGIAGH